jgi:hypothetical protein
VSWKKHFKTANTGGNKSPINGELSQSSGTYRNYQSQLPEVYIGHPNRVERYNQYEQMDMDPEVNAALDIIAEFATQPNIENGTAFDVRFKEKPTDNEIKIIKEQLTQWCSLNQFNKRLFKVFRNTIKYGDQIFLRDPETFKLFWTEVYKVTKVIVNESDGKEPEQYVIKDLAPNFMNLTATAITTSEIYTNSPQGGGGGGGAYIQPSTPGVGGSRFTHAQNEACIDAEHIMHLSLTEGLDSNWPFGNSILESIFKIFKQKELLEDSIIIYRIQRAPERRVFKIDVGNMPSHMAMAFVDRIKNEVHQRRIPTQTGGGQNMMDATYNPLSTNEDFFFPVTADGRGSSVDVFPGGQNLGEITDLRYFTNKMFRGLRIPSSYLPTQAEDSERVISNGSTTALIQEWRFNQYLMRLQNLIADKLDTEFKMFMRWRGINIDNNLFELHFNEPQNFAKHRQAEIDGVRIASFTQLEAFPYLSKRFLLKRYLDLSEEEMQDNEEMWAEENADVKDTTAPAAGLRSVGITPSGIESDMGNFEEPMGDEGIMPEGEPVGGAVPAPAMSPVGSAAPAAAPAGL